MHPSFQATHDPEILKRTHSSIEERIYEQSRRIGVLVSKGSWFAVDHTVLHDTYFRLTFAAAPEKALEQAVERFGQALRIEFGLTSK